MVAEPNKNMHDVWDDTKESADAALAEPELSEPTRYEATPDAEGNDAERDLMLDVGLASWEDISKDELLEVVPKLSNLDEEVTFRIIDKFPSFEALVLGAFDQVKVEATKVRRFNWRSQKRVHKAFKQYRDILSKELERGNLTPEERFAILGLLKDAIDAEAAKDSENKKFQLIVTGMLSTAAILAAGAALVAVSLVLQDDDETDQA